MRTASHLLLLAAQLLSNTSAAPVRPEASVLSAASLNASETKNTNKHSVLFKRRDQSLTANHKKPKAVAKHALAQTAPQPSAHVKSAVHLEAYRLQTIKRSRSLGTTSPSKAPSKPQTNSQHDVHFTAISENVAKLHHPTRHNEAIASHLLSRRRAGYQTWSDVLAHRSHAKNGNATAHMSGNKSVSSSRVTTKSEYLITDKDSTFGFDMPTADLSSGDYSFLLVFSTLSPTGLPASSFDGDEIATETLSAEAAKKMSSGRLDEYCNSRCLINTHCTYWNRMPDADTGGEKCVLMRNPTGMYRSYGTRIAGAPTSGKCIGAVGYDIRGEEVKTVTLTSEDILRERDAECCAQCKDSIMCEFWVRDGDQCHLRRRPTGVQVPSATMRFGQPDTRICDSARLSQAKGYAASGATLDSHYSLRTTSATAIQSMKIPKGCVVTANVKTSHSPNEPQVKTFLFSAPLFNWFDHTNNGQAYGEDKLDITDISYGVYDENTQGMYLIDRGVAPNGDSLITDEIMHTAHGTYNFWGGSLVTGSSPDFDPTAYSSFYVFGGSMLREYSGKNYTGTVESPVGSSKTAGMHFPQLGHDSMTAMQIKQASDTSNCLTASGDGVVSKAKCSALTAYDLSQLWWKDYVEGAQFQLKFLHADPDTHSISTRCLSAKDEGNKLVGDRFWGMYFSFKDEDGHEAQVNRKLWWTTCDAANKNQRFEIMHDYAPLMGVGEAGTGVTSPGNYDMIRSVVFAQGGKSFNINMNCQDQVDAEDGDAGDMKGTNGVCLAEAEVTGNSAHPGNKPVLAVNPVQSYKLINFRAPEAAFIRGSWILGGSVQKIDADPQFASVSFGISSGNAQSEEDEQVYTQVASQEDTTEPFFINDAVVKFETSQATTIGSESEATYSVEKEAARERMKSMEATCPLTCNVPTYVDAPVGAGSYIGATNGVGSGCPVSDPHVHDALMYIWRWQEKIESTDLALSGVVTTCHTQCTCTSEPPRCPFGSCSDTYCLGPCVDNPRQDVTTTVVDGDSEAVAPLPSVCDVSDAIGATNEDGSADPTYNPACNSYCTGEVKMSTMTGQWSTGTSDYRLREHTVSPSDYGKIERYQIPGGGKVSITLPAGCAMRMYRLASTYEVSGTHLIRSGPYDYDDYLQDFQMDISYGSKCNPAAWLFGREIQIHNKPNDRWLRCTGSGADFSGSSRSSSNTVWLVGNAGDGKISLYEETRGKYLKASGTTMTVESEFCGDQCSFDLDMVEQTNNFGDADLANYYIMSKPSFQSKDRAMQCTPDGGGAFVEDALLQWETMSIRVKAGSPNPRGGYEAFTVYGYDPSKASKVLVHDQFAELAGGNQNVCRGKLYGAGYHNSIKLSGATSHSVYVQPAGAALAFSYENFLGLPTNLRPGRHAHVAGTEPFSLQVAGRGITTLQISTRWEMMTSFDREDSTPEFPEVEYGVEFNQEVSHAKAEEEMTSVANTVESHLTLGISVETSVLGVEAVDIDTGVNWDGVQSFESSQATSRAIANTFSSTRTFSTSCPLACPIPGHNQDPVGNGPVLYVEDGIGSTCPQDQHGGRVFVWRWTAFASEQAAGEEGDKGMEVETCHLQCTCTPEPPACDFAMCADQWCTTCKANLPLETA